MTEPGSYAAAGVHLDAAERTVRLLSQVAEVTRRPEVLGGIGGFGGLFALDVGRWHEPVLVSSADGVGTKMELARRLGRLDTIGHDLVAMVVDDIVVSGAEPLFLADYIAVGRLEPERVATVVAGVAAGCRVAGCALVGGETAEHPGVMEPDQLDLAGFGVGVVERSAVLGPDRVRPGDVLVAMAADGLHANGYSLVRHLVAGLDLDADHGLDRPLGDVLLQPTRIYARDCLALVEQVEVHALCHVTGGGLLGNLPRVLPPGVGADVDAASWQWPAIFTWLQRRGPLRDDDMWTTFNCGVGMVAIVAADAAEAAMAVLAAHDVPAWVAGVVSATPGIRLT